MIHRGRQLDEQTIQIQQNNIQFDNNTNEQFISLLIIFIKLTILSELFMKTELKWQIPVANHGDFITNIRYDEQSNAIILIHEQPLLNVVIGLENLTQFQSQSITLKAETNIYDSLIVGNSLIVSNRNMPVRLYTLPKEGEPQSMHWISFSDKKQNSELFLFPLQFCKQEEVVIGGGKKFMSQYDCVKLCVTRRFKQMFKRYTSAVELVNNSMVVAGQFDGQITFMDIRAEQTCFSMKPHFDLVTKIKRVPQNDSHIVSLARKDNFSYLWDVRKLDTFLNCYEQPLYGNQRTGLDMSKDGKILFLGGESGNITARNIQDNQIKANYTSNIPKCISSICNINETVIYAVGERDFPLDKQQQKSGCIGSFVLQE